MQLVCLAAAADGRCGPLDLGVRPRTGVAHAAVRWARAMVRL